jgi:hypothetical protein
MRLSVSAKPHAARADVNRFKWDGYSRALTVICAPGLLPFLSGS